MPQSKKTVGVVEAGTELNDGRFLVRRQLNKGATAVVYEALDRRSGSPVALKVLRMADGRMVVRLKQLKREVECAASNVHENVARLLDLFAVGVQIVLVWEFIDGMDLLDLLNERGGKVSEEEAAFYLYQVANGVAYLHAKGFCHGDIKAENCMVEKDSNVTKIIDFGLSRRLESANTASAGTPDYMTPEVIHAMYQKKKVEIDGKAVDVWSMGILLYLLVTGTYPFEDAKNSNQTIWNIIKFRMKPLPSHVTHDCAALIKAMVAFSPTERMHAYQLLNDPWLIHKARLHGAKVGFVIGGPAPLPNSAEAANESVHFNRERRCKRKSSSLHFRWKNFWRRCTPCLLNTGIH